jgi:hypothetical protein
MIRVKRNGKTIEIKKRKIGTVPLKYVTEGMMLHSCIAEGDIDGVKFKIHNGFEMVYVEFVGLKGRLAKIGILIDDLAQLSYDAAKKHNLLKP